MSRAAMSEESLATAVRRHAEATPDHVAVIDGNRRLTYCDLDDKARRLVTSFRSLGIPRGGVISVQLPNIAEFVVVAVAAAYGGYVLNPISIRFRRTELLHVVIHAGSGAFVYAQEVAGFDHRQLAADIADEISGLVRVVIGEAAFPEERTYAALLEEVAATPADLEPIGLDELCTILHSSGTEGRPKLPMHTERSFMHDTLAIAERSRLSRDDRFLACTPLTTGTGTHGMVHCALVLGACIVLQPHWEPGLAARLVAEHSCTYTVGPSTMLFDLLQEKSATADAMRSLRLFTCGGAPIPRHLVSEATDRLGFTVTPMYGSTESLALTCAYPGDSMDKITGTDGLPLFGVDLGVVNDLGARLPPGEIGEVVARGPTLFQGYAGQPAQTSEVLVDGWLRTGDIGSIDDDGYVQILDRRKDLIVRGGMNVSSRDVEDAVARYPSIVQAAAVSLEDERLGERIGVFVAVEAGAPRPDLSEVLRFLELEGVAKYKWPEHLEYVDNLPRNASGKIDKEYLRGLLSSRDETT